MNAIAQLALLGFLPFSIVLFAVLPARRALIASYLIAWLFLPMAGFSIAGFPDYSKTTAATLGALVGIILFDSARLTRIRFAWWDIVMLIWVFCPIPSSLTSGVGAYEGFSASLQQIVLWGLPYLAGRLYFSDLQGIRELCIGIFIGGLIYVPLCLWESRMSPQLHSQIYGFNPHTFSQTMRFGGYRPQVFMQHGLMVGLWMSAASICGFWLWQKKIVKYIYGIPMSALVCIQVLTTVWCKSLGAAFLMFLGMGLLWCTRWKFGRWAICAVIAFIPFYMVTRTTGIWSGESTINMLEEIFGTDRAASLATRFENEDLLTERALQQPLFGWGRRDFLVRDESGQNITIPDGYWVIAFGQNGFVGLLAMFTLLLAPVLIVLRKSRRIPVGSPLIAPLLATSVIVLVWSMDNLMNAMFNPIYVLIIGGVTGFVLRVPLSKPSQQATMTPRHQVGLPKSNPRPRYRRGRVHY